MENKLFSSTLAKKKELKTYLVLFWDNAEYLGLYLACFWAAAYFFFCKSRLVICYEPVRVQHDDYLTLKI